MITQENIKDLLLCLGFEKSENSANDVMTCHFANINADISAQLQISVAYFCSIGLYFLV